MGSTVYRTTKITIKNLKQEQEDERKDACNQSNILAMWASDTANGFDDQGSTELTHTPIRSEPAPLEPSVEKNVALHSEYLRMHAKRKHCKLELHAKKQARKTHNCLSKGAVRTFRTRRY